MGGIYMCNFTAMDCYLDVYKRQAIESGECAGKAVPEVAEIMGVVKKKFPEASHENMGFGSTIFAVKPGRCV